MSASSRVWSTRRNAFNSASEIGGSAEEEAAVDAALAAVRGAPGVQAAATTSLAMGGTSVMRVTVSTDIGTLADALRARGGQAVQDRHHDLERQPQR